MLSSLFILPREKSSYNLIGGVLKMVSKKELEKFLNHLQDKVEDCYKKETEQAIKEFLKDIK